MVLMGKRAKMNPRVVATVGALILLGYYFEKWLMIALAVPVTVWLQVAETLILGGLFVTFMMCGGYTLPRVERAADPTPALSPIETK